MKTFPKNPPKPKTKVQELELHRKRLYSAIDKLELLSEEALNGFAKLQLRLDFVRVWKPVKYSAPKSTEIRLSTLLVSKGKDICRSELVKELEMTEKNIKNLKVKKQDV